MKKCVFKAITYNLFYKNKFRLLQNKLKITEKWWFQRQIYSIVMVPMIPKVRQSVLGWTGAAVQKGEKLQCSYRRTCYNTSQSKSQPIKNLNFLVIKDISCHKFSSFSSGMVTFLSRQTKQTTFLFCSLIIQLHPMYFMTWYCIIKCTFSFHLLFLFVFHNNFVRLSCRLLLRMA